MLEQVFTGNKLELTDGVKCHPQFWSIVITEQNLRREIIRVVLRLTEAVILRSSRLSIHQLNRSILQINKKSFDRSLSFQL